MIYRTCTGCAKQGVYCEARELVKLALIGVNATSIKWKCKSRVPRINVGDPVWALTNDGGEPDEEGNPYKDYFPGIAVKEKGSKMIVLIEPGAIGMDEELKFATPNRGFCKIPLSRIKIRHDERQQVCKYCCWPSSKGHEPGWSCEKVHA